MRNILAAMLVLVLFAAAFAGPPVDYELNCGEGDGAILIGVLSLTEGKVHVALLEDFVCEGVDVVVVGPDLEPEVVVLVDLDAEPPVTVTIDAAPVPVEDVDLVVVPQVAIDGMLTAQRLRTAAMEMRREAAERGETDRDRIAWDDDGAPGDGEPGDPPVDVPPGDGPGGPPDETPRGDGTGEGSGRRP